MKTVKVKQGKARATGKLQPVHAARRTQAATTLSDTIRKEYKLSRPLFARLLDIAVANLARWENNGKPPKQVQTKSRKIAGLLKGLSRVMPKADIPIWLTSPNDACRSIGEQTPADLLRKGRYDKIESMIYFFESGVAY